MRVIIIFLIALLCWLDAMATAQMSDRIIYKGKEYILRNNPLEEYFEKYPEKQPRGGVVSSALWRGYVATFEVRNDMLYLKDIEVMYQDTTSKESYNYKWRSVLKEVVSDGKELAIDWMTALLEMPYGEKVEDGHIYYIPQYQNIMLLEVQNGIVKREKSFGYSEYAEFIERQYQAFRKTEAYTEFKDAKHGETMETFLRNNIIKYSSRVLTD